MPSAGMNISITLPPELVSFIQAKVETGRYGSTSDVVQEALRLLAQADRHEADETARLRQAWDEGTASGDDGPLDFAELRTEARRRLAARGRER